MQPHGSFTIDPRFRGPPNSANGGYCCGCIARLSGEPVEVTLKSPPPLAKRLEFVEGELRHEGTVLASTRATDLEFELPTPISFDEASARERHYIGHTAHPYPECFVCGPRREAGDGLRIFPGRSQQHEPVAAGFVPDETLADAEGLVGTEFLWSALDCPGYFGVSREPTKALLGRMTGAIERPVRVGERLIVMAWSLGRDGRKLHAASALLDEAGEPVARSRQTWIEVA